MSTPISTVSDLIKLWPSAEVFGDDLNLKYRSYGRVMRFRGRIPERRWPDVVAAAERRGIDGVNIGLLEELHAATKGGDQ